MLQRLPVYGFDLFKVGLHRFGNRLTPQAGNTLLEFAGLGRLITVQIILRTPAMGFQITPGFGLAVQSLQQQNQRQVFVNIGKIAGMKAVLIAEHGVS
jgi:hypothetical protein